MVCFKLLIGNRIGREGLNGMKYVIKVDSALQSVSCSRGRAARVNDGLPQPSCEEGRTETTSNATWRTTLACSRGTRTRLGSKMGPNCRCRCSQATTRRSSATSEIVLPCLRAVTRRLSTVLGVRRSNTGWRPVDLRPAPLRAPPQKGFAPIFPISGRGMPFSSLRLV